MPRRKLIREEKRRILLQRSLKRIEPKKEYGELHIFAHLGEILGCGLVRGGPDFFSALVGEGQQLVDNGFGLGLNAKRLGPTLLSFDGSEGIPAHSHAIQNGAGRLCRQHDLTDPDGNRIDAAVREGREIGKHRSLGVGESALLAHQCVEGVRLDSLFQRGVEAVLEKIVRVDDGAVAVVELDRLFGVHLPQQVRSNHDLLIVGRGHGAQRRLQQLQPRVVLLDVLGKQRQLKVQPRLRLYGVVVNFSEPRLDRQLVVAHGVGGAEQNQQHQQARTDKNGHCLFH